MKITVDYPDDMEYSLPIATAVKEAVFEALKRHIYWNTDIKMLNPAKGEFNLTINYLEDSDA